MTEPIPTIPKDTVLARLAAFKRSRRAERKQGYVRRSKKLRLPRAIGAQKKQPPLAKCKRPRQVCELFGNVQ